MRVGVRMVLWFGAVWFGGELADVLWPPPNQVFDAALAVTAAMACMARHFDRTRP